MRMGVYNQVIYQILTYIRFFVSHDTDVQILILSITTNKSAKRNSSCSEECRYMQPVGVETLILILTVFSLIIFFFISEQRQTLLWG